MSKSKNNEKKELLYVRYGKVCMFTGVKRDLTFHHIDKAEFGGPTTVDNGSVLSGVSQGWLHNYIEPTDPALFDLINECLLLYKMVMDKGDQELIQQYRDEIMPEFIARIAIYEKKHYHAPQKTLTKRR